MVATPPKTFDSVASSRQWRETTSRKLDAMSHAERLPHYASLMKQAAGKVISSDESKMLKA
jgi:hypothetical protein